MVIFLILAMIMYHLRNFIYFFILFNYSEQITFNTAHYLKEVDNNNKISLRASSLMHSGGGVGKGRGGGGEAVMLVPGID